MNNIEHIAFAVRSLSNAIPLFEKLLGTPCYKTETVETEKVKTAFSRQVKARWNCWKALLKMG